MRDANTLKSLGELGKRIERLFYFGSLLLLLGCLNLYFVSLAKYVERENPDDIKILISTVAANFETLVERFENPPTKQPSVQISENEETSQLRKKLGLPPREEESTPSKTNPVKSYSELLEDILDEIKYKARLSRDSLLIAKDSSKSPQEIMSQLEHRRDQIAKRPVTIWGVESPLILPLQYGGARYQVPASFIAKSLSLALFPIFLGWLGSLHLTRHRELLLIRRLRFYGHTFPHILNIFPITISMGEAVESTFRLRNKRKNAAEVWAWKLLPSILRSIVIIVFCVPMTVLLGYSFIQLFLISDDSSFALNTLFSILLIWFVLQILGLLIQEWILLWDKTYHA